MTARGWSREVWYIKDHISNVFFAPFPFLLRVVLNRTGGIIRFQILFPARFSLLLFLGRGSQEGCALDLSSRENYFSYFFQVPNTLHTFFYLYHEVEERPMINVSVE